MTVRICDNLFYITHVDNLPSMLENGILSHSQLAARGLPSTPIYDSEIVSNRMSKLTPAGKTLWDYANLYFQPRNPMLYRVIDEKGLDNIAIISVQRTVLTFDDIFITDGNAASVATEFYEKDQGLKILADLNKTLSSEWWSEENGTKRKIMAECLVPDSIPAECIQTVYVANQDIAEKLQRKMGDSVPIIIEPDMFFLSKQYERLTDNLYLVQGDLFFSKMHTLTVSVNTVGVMGRGLASRAKYQFPDVYVHYQDICRNKTLVMGKPFVYKRETSLDYQMADMPDKLTKPNLATWFLLFPTKNHWREKSDIKGIEQGMAWLAEHYEKEKIKSLAIPALGCGLGWLEWKDVGPIMVKYLKEMKIPVRLYLPSEKKIKPEHLQPEYLLSRE